MQDCDGAMVFGVPGEQPALIAVGDVADLRAVGVHDVGGAQSFGARAVFISQITKWDAPGYLSGIEIDGDHLFGTVRRPLSGTGARAQPSRGTGQRAYRNGQRAVARAEPAPAWISAARTYVSQSSCAARRP